MVIMILEWLCRLRDSCRRANVSSRDHGATQGNCCTEESYGPLGSGFNRRGNVYPMIRNGSPPKCLSRLPLSQILLGKRLEDVLPDNHLERFDGHQANSDVLPPRLDLGNGTSTASYEIESSDQIDDERCSGPVSSLDLGNDSVTRNYEVVSLDQFVVERDSETVYVDFLMSSDEEDAVVDSPNGYSQANEPPSYFDLFNEPPPAYTEAVGRESDGNAQHVTRIYVTPKERKLRTENQ